MNQKDNKPTNTNTYKPGQAKTTTKNNCQTQPKGYKRHKQTLTKKPPLKVNTQTVRGDKRYIQQMSMQEAGKHDMLQEWADANENCCKSHNEDMEATRSTKYACGVGNGCGEPSKSENNHCDD